ncbi:Remorin, C-terminal region [Carex littledalei]|uniref:Remorin, C-terminal region n=1 Tax=Carex littledalei TaxID=544730 RepID=A0A833VH97_9POAL|nr:Remorin, C-terminal region [Carex littledalei]
MPGAELTLEKRRSRLGDGRRRRRKREKESSSDTFLQSSDETSGSAFDQDDELLSLARGECTNGPVPVPDPAQEKEKQIIEARDPAFQQENQDPSQNILSDKVKECQNRRYPQESIPPMTRKLSRQRPASLDLNGHISGDVAALSPFVGLGVMNNKGSVNFHSPGTPVYQHRPGCHSERVPLGRQNYNRATPPFNKGRNLPSKWEDAERWIFSPVSGELVRRTHVPQFNRRRPQSKSGPLGSDEAGLMSSPSTQVFNNSRVGNFVKSSPLWAGVLIPEGGPSGRNCTARASFPNCASVGHWIDTPLESSCSFPSSRGSVQDDRIENTRKDVATQTSPCESTNSSPKATPLFISSSKSTMANQIEEELESHFTELQIENSFQADNRVTLTRWSKKHVVQGPDKCLTNIIEWKRRTVEAKASPWQVTKNANCISKFETEEAKIAAWESMQKVKAEAAIEKLVMKLERKRSSSMDKILNKLKFAQKRAQEMRTQTQTSSNQTQKLSRGSKQVPHFHRNGQMASLSGCFTCHAF